MGRAGGGEVYCLRGEEVRDCLCCSPIACVWAAVLSGCRADLSHWLASVSSLLKCESNWGKLVEAKKHARDA